MSRFNVRKEFEKIAEAEAKTAREIFAGDFSRKKGTLRLPVAGKVVSGFGRQFDPKSNLWVFKKGLEVMPARDGPVSAVYPGRVVFAGELFSYGNVVILDHGKNFYSLAARLSRIDLRVGDLVAEGDPIGQVVKSGETLYFEIRSGNVAVNPLKWVGSSISLE
jgi:septal ring factor EnvC (AmiA/AmiB activator)